MSGVKPRRPLLMMSNAFTQGVFHVQVIKQTPSPPDKTSSRSARRGQRQWSRCRYRSRCTAASAFDGLRPARGKSMPRHWWRSRIRNFPPGTAGGAITTQTGAVAVLRPFRRVVTDPHFAPAERAQCQRFSRSRFPSCPPCTSAATAAGTRTPDRPQIRTSASSDTLPGCIRATADRGQTGYSPARGVLNGDN